MSSSASSFKMFPGAIHWSGRTDPKGDWKIPKIGKIWNQSRRGMTVVGMQLDSVRPETGRAEDCKKRKQKNQKTVDEDEDEDEDEEEDEKEGIEMNKDTELEC